MEYPKSELFEKLADIEHQRWADWQNFLHSKCKIKTKAALAGMSVIKINNGLIIPQDCVERWERQINTPYSELTKKEKDSDREQVMRYWKLITNKK